MQNRLAVPLVRAWAGLTPGRVAVLAVFATWCLSVVWSRLLLYVGIIEYRHWFIDSYAVLAASDAVRVGIDPNQANPLDPLLRNHKYSDWWFAFGRLGITRHDNFLVGLSWVAALLGGAWATLRPRTWRDALWFAVTLISPPLLLVVNRANNDLVIFGLAAAAILALAVPRWPRLLLAAVAVAVATGLKYYPVVAVAGFLTVRPRRRLICGAGVAALLAMAALLDVADTLPRGQFDMPATLHTFGAPVLLLDLGWAAPAGRILGALLVLGIGAWLAATRRTTGLGAVRPAEAAGPVIGLVMLLACFFGGISYGYRWIFVLWPGYWLWQRAADPALPSVDRRWALGASLLLLATLWLDGLLCIVVNGFHLPVAPGGLELLQYRWRLATQPLVWVLMALYVGWLADWLGRCWRECRHEPAGAGVAQSRPAG